MIETERSQLRIRDLKAKVPTRVVMLNVKLPGRVWKAIDTLSRHLGTTKAEVVIALLNEGLGRRPRRRGR